MSELEYKTEMETILANFELAKKELYSKYAKTQRKFSIGDIIKDEDRNIFIKVEKYKIHIEYGGIPTNIYIGVELTKKLVPNKKGAIGHIYGNNTISLIQKTN